ncbi:unnamed protein product [Protopolystoma xenopodis]|uniref:Miro domain-containing protein n=1 Tax=Protopolystoma xenopodis TaxID=117903 RepID=A0A448WMM0_9PLAT|nr:unnamed protein product [Protopolystoma xenopodis]
MHGTGGHAIGGVTGRASAWAAAIGLPVYGQLRCLLMHEIGAAAGEQMTAGEALSADVACLVYDVTDPCSFTYIANLFLNYYRGTRVPCLIVAAKSDQPSTLQDYRLHVSEFISKYHLSEVQSFSSLDIKPRSPDRPPLSSSHRAFPSIGVALDASASESKDNQTNGVKRRSGSAHTLLNESRRYGQRPSSVYGAAVEGIDDQSVDTTSQPAPGIFILPMNACPRTLVSF